MTETRPKILFVDDEILILEAMKRQLRGQFEIEVVNSAQKALERMKETAPFAVIVADMTMPQMDGAQFLAQTLLLSPHSIRMMLTGNREQSVASRAINEGKIFRFLQKPCTPADLSKALHEALEQHGREQTERELLQNTLAASIKVLTDILQACDPIAFGVALEMRNDFRRVLEKMSIPLTWEMAIASMLWPIGNIFVPDELLIKKEQGELLTEAEQKVFFDIVTRGAKMVAQIPRLQGVAAIIEHQDHRYDGKSPGSSLKGEELPFPSRVIKILKERRYRTQQGKTVEEAYELMSKTTGEFDMQLLEEVRNIELGIAQGCGDVSAKILPKRVTVPELKVGQVLSENVIANNGKLLVGQGTALSETLIERIRIYSDLVGLRGSISVIESLG